MALTKIPIPWADGTSDRVYLEIESEGGSQTINVTSDYNYTGFERNIQFVFKTNATGKGTISEATLNIRQFSDDLVVATFDDQVATYEEQRAGYMPKN